MITATNTAINKINESIVMSIKFTSSKKIVLNVPVESCCGNLTMKGQRPSVDGMSNMGEMEHRLDIIIKSSIKNSVNDSGNDY